MRCGIERQRLGLRWWKHTKKRDDDIIFYKKNENHLVSATWSFLLLNCTHWQQAWAENSLWSFMPCFLCRGQQASTQQEVLTRESGDQQPGGQGMFQRDREEGEIRPRSSNSTLGLRKCTQTNALPTAQCAILYFTVLPHVRSLLLGYSYKRKGQFISIHIWKLSK